MKIVILALLCSVASLSQQLPERRSSLPGPDANSEGGILGVGIYSAGTDPAGIVGHVHGISRMGEMQAPRPAGSSQTGNGSAVAPSVTYTCDPSITAISGVCSTLNTTIAALYTNTFTDVNVSIYITFGATGLGQSTWVFGKISYTTFRNALNTDRNGSNDLIAFANSVPAVNPINSTYMVGLTNANLRALGLSPSTGLMSDASTFCSLGTAGCYDGIITISSTQQSQSHLYYRTGSITGNQYDFYTVVQHETDEVLGTASCAFFTCGSSPQAIFPADLYRYSSNGARSFGAGNNNSCTSSNSGNACFSIDGVNMLHQYNNVNNGQDAGDWFTNCATPFVQDAVGCPGVAGLNITQASEILVLDVVGYTLAHPPSVSPASGSGSVQTFTGSYTDANGYNDLKWVQMLFAVATNGGGQAFCFVHYDAQGGGLWLFSDVLGFFVGPVTPGNSSNLLQGSLCALNTSGSSASGNGNTLTLNTNLVFKQALALNIYTRSYTIGGFDTGWVQQGTWTTAAASLGTMTVAPSSGTVTHGTQQSFTLTYPDTPGFAGAAFGWEQFLVAVSSNGGGQPYCYVHYDRAANRLWMYSSDVGFFLGPVAPGVSSSLLSSSACSVNTASSSVLNSAGNLILTVPITLKTPMVGAQKLFERALTVLNVDTGFVQTGTLTVN